MKTLGGALSAALPLITVIALMQAADAQHLRQPKHNQRVHGNAPKTHRRYAVSFGRARTPVPRLHGQPWSLWIRFELPSENRVVQSFAPAGNQPDADRISSRHKAIAVVLIS